MRKLGPPLLAGESASRGEDFPSVVFSFTHDALSDIHFTIKKKKKNEKQPIRQLYIPLISSTSHASLTFLLIKVTVDVSLHLCVAPITHPGQVFTGDSRTSLIVKRSVLRDISKSKILYIHEYKLTAVYYVIKNPFLSVNTLISQVLKIINAACSL